MPKITPGQAKNSIRRALRAVIDLEPSSAEITQLWEYFGSRCAYCSRTLNRANREGHIDHLISGGTNHISNRVLACASCNGDEKQESDWIEFLRKKAPNELELRSRCEHIQLWCSSHTPEQPRLIDAAAQAEIDRAIKAFDMALANLRRLCKERGEIE